MKVWKLVLFEFKTISVWQYLWTCFNAGFVGLLLSYMIIELGILEGERGLKFIVVSLILLIFLGLPTSFVIQSVPYRLKHNGVSVPDIFSLYKTFALKETEVIWSRIVSQLLHGMFFNTMLLASVVTVFILRGYPVFHHLGLALSWLLLSAVAMFVYVMCERYQGRKVNGYGFSSYGSLLLALLLLPVGLLTDQWFYGIVIEAAIRTPLWTVLVCFLLFLLCLVIIPKVLLYQLRKGNKMI
ncbi:hypothetical protein [Shouchella lonarensis]|uniref:Uncharacterized protein n=1 Tax=Shouchella lonarensis TaxID=1464122 RepID=A0A1G6GV88_9BACI|nr:hypothetical protein [Shouchella lonarensis]SDB85932.1 hypothetical protein SAMN05421737_10260 [Shouchella lonarensis]